MSADGKKAHRYDDPRSCGAKTVVEGQNFTYVNGKLWAVKNDPNDHGEGRLIPSQNFCFINGKEVIRHKPDDAYPDDLCPFEDAEHCHPETTDGSFNTFVG